MDKKKCPQCKNLILVSAPTCLYCGRPNKFVTKNYVNQKWKKNYKNLKIDKYNNYFLKFVLIFIVILILILFFIMF